MKYLNYIFSNKVNKETFWALISKGISALFGFFILVFIPRVSGADIFGGFSLILAYIYILGIFFGVSVQDSVRKEITEEKFSEKSKIFFIEGLRIKIVLSVMASIILYIALYFIDITIIKDNLMQFLLLLVIINIWGSIVTFFEATHRLFFEAVMYIIEYSTKTILLLYFYLFSRLTLENILFCFITGYLMAVIAGIIITFFKLGRFHLKDFELHHNTIRKVLHRTIFLSLSGIFFVILSRIDTIMISVLLSVRDVGFYSIASEITKQSTLLSLPVLLGIMPLFVDKKIKKHFKDAMMKFWIINIALFLAIFALSDYAVRLIYGPEYNIVGLLLKILAVLPLLMTLQTFTSQVLLLKDAVKQIFLFGAAATVLNISLNYLGIIWFGLIGAAFATVISYTLWFFLNYIYIKKNYF
jgi:O-antigen/teichoic acid export membrane protein